MPPTLTPEQALADSRRWLEQAVIGLNLCPFAKSVHTKGLVHWMVSPANTAEALLLDLKNELQSLAGQSEQDRETTLLIAPWVLGDFLDFNEFLALADATLVELGLEGEFQMASFHPDYQFAGTQADDVTNCTNRSPYPTLHLLRESSIDRAVAVYPEAETIYERNLDTLQRLGAPGWAALGVGPGQGTPQAGTEST